jgi:phenylacetate-coenzyme A ligase PaaK-like adenylate-forming protein
MTGGARLHPSVELTATAEGGFELHDRRTDLRLAFDDVPAPRGPEVEGELRDLCDELGLLDAGLTEREVRGRQSRFQASRAWDDRLERLRALLSFVVQKVPYYRERGAAYDGGGLDGPEALRALPIMRKADVRAAFTRLCPDDLDVPAEVARGRLELVSTSGTTDERLQALSDATLVRVPQDYDAVFGIAARDDVPRTAVLTSVTCLAQGCTLGPDDPSKRLVHDYTLYLPTVRDPFALDRDDVQRIADEMAAFDAAFLFVNPVYAHLLGRRAAELGIALPRVALVISCYQYLSEVQRRALARYFDAPVRNLYAATELGGCQVGLECLRGRLHVREDHCLVEAIAGDGPAGSGQVGALVVTTLASTTMPLVRYAVGDLGALLDEDPPCDCPLAAWPALRFHGRERDALFVGGRFYTTRDVDAIVGAEPGLDFYCCRQVGEAELVVEVVPAAGQPFRPEALVERLRAAIPGAKVTARPQRRLEPAPSLKYPLTAREVAAPPWIR